MANQDITPVAMSGARETNVTLARTFAADRIVPFDHVVKAFQVQFFSPYLRVVALSPCCMIDDPPYDASRDDDLITRRGPTPIAVVDPGLVVAKVALDEGADVVSGPYPDRDVTIIPRGPPAILDALDYDPTTPLLAAQLGLASSSKPTHRLLFFPCRSFCDFRRAGIPC
jgi:hypothetical protein